MMTHRSHTIDGLTNNDRTVYGATARHARPAARSPSPANARRPGGTNMGATAPRPGRSSPAPRRAPSPRGRFDPTQYVEEKRRQQQEAQRRLGMHPNQRSGAWVQGGGHGQHQVRLQSGASSPAMSRASSWASSTQRASPRYLQPIGNVRGSPHVGGGWRGGEPSPASRAPLHTLSSAERNIADIDSRLHALQDFLRAAAHSSKGR